MEETGLERWLATRGLGRQLEGWRAQRQRGDQFIELLLTTRERLRALYDTKLPRDQLRARKQEEFGRLKFEYWQLKARWNGYSGYDYWFDRALNNAYLVTAATYHGCLPAFKNLLIGEWRAPASTRSARIAKQSLLEPAAFESARWEEMGQHTTFV